MSPSPSPDMPASGMSAEPVAWQYRHKDNWPAMWSFISAPWPEAWGTQQWQRVPLYTADSLTQELAAKDKEIEGLRAECHATKRSEAYALYSLEREISIAQSAQRREAELEAQLTALRSLVTEAAPVFAALTEEVGRMRVPQTITDAAIQVNITLGPTYQRALLWSARLNEAVKP